MEPAGVPPSEAADGVQGVQRPAAEEQRAHSEEVDGAEHPVLSADDTVHDVYRRLSDVGADLACDLLERYPTDFETRPNETTPDDYHTLPTPAERRRFRRRGNAFL